MNKIKAYKAARAEAANKHEEVQILGERIARASRKLEVAKAEALALDAKAVSLYPDASRELHS